MSKELSKNSKQELAERPADQPKKFERGASSLPASALPFNPFLTSGFFSFRYSYQEMSSSKGKTQVRSQEYRYEDGKLSSEQFEGTTHGIVYDQAAQNMQHLISNSIDFFYKSFASMLHSAPDNKDKD